MQPNTSSLRTASPFFYPSLHMAAIPCGFSSFPTCLTRIRLSSSNSVSDSATGIDGYYGYGYPKLKIRNYVRRRSTLVCFSSSSSFTWPWWSSASGKVGSQTRQGNVSLLTFGANPRSFSNEANAGSTSQLLSAMLPYVVAATAVAALVNPVTFAWVSKDYYAPALGGIMLSIGIRMSVDDFALAFQRPLPLSIGFMAQYLFKPMLGLLIARVFGAPRMFYAGFILTCCVAGAQLSSYASFLSKGDVALSILLTSSTTITSVVITPLLTGLLIGSVVPVDAVAMSKSILQVVLVPVTLGLILNTYAKPIVNVIQPVMPFVAMFCTSLCIGSPLAINRNQILSTEGIRLLLPILAFHLVAFTAGYWVPKLPCWRQEERVCRTISLCTGMQSSTLAGLLASQFLGSSHSVPPACSVVAMAIMGLSLASFWGNGSRIRDIALWLFPQIRNTSLNT